MEKYLLKVSKCFQNEISYSVKNVPGFWFLDFIGTFWTYIILIAIKFPTIFLYSNSSIQPVAHILTAT